MRKLFDFLGNAVKISPLGLVTFNGHEAFLSISNRRGSGQMVYHEGTIRFTNPNKDWEMSDENDAIHEILSTLIEQHYGISGHKISFDYRGRRNGIWAFKITEDKGVE